MAEVKLYGFPPVTGHKHRSGMHGLAMVVAVLGEPTIFHAFDSKMAPSTTR